jgi:hypothetical protein
MEDGCRALFRSPWQFGGKMKDYIKVVSIGDRNKRKKIK